MDTTARRAISVPKLDRSDDPDIPQHIRNLSDKIDRDIPYLEDLAANIPPSSMAGRIFRATDTGDIYFDNGTTWQIFGSIADRSVTAAKLAPQTIVPEAGSYVLVVGDRFKAIRMDSATPVTLTVPTNLSEPFSIGDSVDIIQYGAGQVTIGGAGGVIVNGNPGLKTIAQFVIVTLIKMDTNTWLAVGGLTP